MSFSLATAPETIEKQFLRSFRLYRSSFLHTLIFSFIFAAIVFLPHYIFIITGFHVFAVTDFLDPRKFLFLLIDIFALFFFTSMLWRIHCVINQSGETLLDDLSKAVKKLPFIVAAALLQSIIIFIIHFLTIGFLFLLMETMLLPPQTTTTGFVLTSAILIIQALAVFYVIFLFYFYLALIVTENRSIIESLKRSATLVFGNWWRVICVQLLPWISFFLAFMIIRGIFALETSSFFFDITHATWQSTFVHMLCFALFAPWIASAMLVQLKDLELRKTLSEPATPGL